MKLMFGTHPFAIKMRDTRILLLALGLAFFACKPKGEQLLKYEIAKVTRGELVQMSRQAGA